ncbi:MAG: hypothetical protein AAF512_04535 [Pseudomonadota bacterium]
MCLLGPYILTIIVYSIRVAENALDKLRPQLSYDDELHAQWHMSFSHHSVKWLIIYAVLGFAASLIILYGHAFTADKPLEYFHPVNISFGIGLVVTWILTLQGIFIAIRNALSFFKLANTHLKIEPWRLEALAPFVHIGVQNILLVMGGLALMPLQTLDVQFRLINYLPPLLVVIPLSLTLLLIPVWGVHRQIVIKINQEIDRVQSKLDASYTEESLSHESVSQLNALIEHKNHLKALPTWPIELPDVYRLMLYLVIPPMSWTGAALIQKWLM